jgi:hypothetical protein
MKRLLSLSLFVVFMVIPTLYGLGGFWKALAFHLYPVRTVTGTITERHYGGRRDLYRFEDTYAYLATPSGRPNPFVWLVTLNDRHGNDTVPSGDVTHTFATDDWVHRGDPIQVQYLVPYPEVSREASHLEGAWKPAVDIVGCAFMLALGVWFFVTVGVNLPFVLKDPKLRAEFWKGSDPKGAGSSLRDALWDMLFPSPLAKDARVVLTRRVIRVVFLYGLIPFFLLSALILQGVIHLSLQ